MLVESSKVSCVICEIDTCVDLELFARKLSSSKYLLPFQKYLNTLLKLNYFQYSIFQLHYYFSDFFEPLISTSSVHLLSAIESEALDFFVLLG